MMNVQSPGRSTGAFVVIACASRLAGDHQVHGLRAFAFLVRFDIETDALTFVQTFQSCLLYCRDVNEHVAPAIIRFDKAISPLAVEEFYDTRLCHQENSSPPLLRRRPHARRLDWTFTIGESVGHDGLSHSAGPHRRRNVTASVELHTNWRPVERAQRGRQGSTEGHWPSGAGRAVSQSSRKPGFPTPPKT